jgi:hypothetical protein
MPWHGQPMPWPWQALAAMALPWQHMPWHGQPMPWPWHALAAMALPWLHMPWPWHCLGRGSLLKTTYFHEKRLAGMHLAALAAQGSWQHAMLHAACTPRAQNVHFRPPAKLARAIFDFSVPKFILTPLEGFPSGQTPMPQEFYFL